MYPLTYIAKPIADARDAIASHIRWKITLLTAARMKESLSERATRSIQQPDECSIRSWLKSELTVDARETPEHAAALATHLEFHRSMQRIAALLNSGRFAEAERQLTEPAGEFERASYNLANALMAFDRAQRSKIAS